MVSVEYVRSLNCNYERMLLEKKPEEKKYQYCILSRGGIRGLLPCGLRYINGNAYLYYDISSKQNVEQLYCNRSLNRRWLLDFLWSMRQIGQELERFLLDVQNIIWSPDQVFLDLETKEYFFLFVPYYEGESTFREMMNFLLEHLDYEDDGLVECVYYMNEQLEQFGEEYLRNKIFEDVKQLEIVEKVSDAMVVPETEKGESEEVPVLREREEKRGLRSILEARRMKSRREKEEYQFAMKQALSGYAVAEESHYTAEPAVETKEDTEYGRTVYIEEKQLQGPKVFRLYGLNGELLATVEKVDLSIGKKRDEVDLALEDQSVSRLHARIIVEQEMAYVEDLNSTNGTFKNGLRLQPYEKRKLDKGDEIRCGKVSMIFRY